MDQPLDLDAIQARCDTATPGPWWNDGHEIYQGEHVGIPAMSTWIGETCTVSLPDYGDANGAFLANARQDVPALLARVRELETALAGMTDLRDRALTRQDQLREKLNTAEVELRRERAAHSSTIDERDRATDCADRLAAVVAPINVRGEHSIGNCPWEAALHHATEQQPAT